MEHSPVTLHAVLVCTAYCILSTACVLHNKFVVSHVYPYETCLLLVQNLVCIAYITVMGSSLLPRVASFLDERAVAHHARVSTSDDESSSSASLSPSPLADSCTPQSLRKWAAAALLRLHVPYTLQHTRADWLVGICYSMSVLTATWSLAYLSVPMSQSIKRCTVIVTWGLELVLAPTATTWRCVPSLLTLLTGIALLSYHDLQFHAGGYFFGFLSCFLQGTSLELGKRLLVNKGKDVWSVLMINSIVSTAVQVVYMLVTQEWMLFWKLVTLQINDETLWSFHRGGHVVTERASPPLYVLSQLLGNGVMIMAMNYTIFLNCSVNSPLAHTVTGNLKAILTVALGIVLWSVPIPWLGYVGLCIGILGGAWFTVVKLKG